MFFWELLLFIWSNRCWQLYITIRNAWGFQFLHTIVNLFSIILFILIEVVLFVLCCMSLISVFFFFMCILVIFTSILRKCLFLSSAHFLNWVVFVLCLLFFIQSGCYSDNRCKSLILWLLFHFLEHVLCRTIYFISDEVQFIFYSVCFCFGDHI